MLLADYTRWRVSWIVRKKGKLVVVEKEFGDDLTSALRLYMKAKNAEKPFATLICKNVGWPPPVALRPYDRWEVVKRDGKKYKRKVHEVPLDIRNGEGVFWCPYCRELRTFRRYAEFRGSKHVVLKCPICGISHRDHHVRKWNPLAARMPDHIERQTRRSNGRQRTRRRRG